MKEFFDIDLKTATDEEVGEIANSLLTNLIVVIRNQSLTAEDEVSFCQRIGECQYLKHDRTKHLVVGEHILRVTGQKNEHGEEGLFGHTSALDWHANQASNLNRSPLIWLYSVEGSVGSRTSWIDMVRAYEDMPEDLKNEIQGVKITLGYKKGSYSDSNFFVEHHATDKPFNLVHTNDAGLTGLYFPFLQIFGMVGKSDTEFESLMSRLKEHVLQPQFTYHHDWEDGDVVISEQWLSIHKRWDFEHMDKRVLHRIAFDYSKVV